jgi:hypothetical protein
MASTGHRIGRLLPFLRRYHFLLLTFHFLLFVRSVAFRYNLQTIAVAGLPFPEWKELMAHG